jgi:disulfide bond formation protein DsbB
LIASAQRFLRNDVAGAVALAALVASLATIAGFLTFESLGFQPCELCLLDRKPYYVAAPLAASTLALALRGEAKIARLGLAGLTLTFAVGAALCVYHAGVEFHWWPGPAECTGALPHATSIEDFLTRLKKVKPIRCDTPALLIFGLSLAAWGAFVCAGLAMLTGWGWRRAGEIRAG